MLDFIFRDFIIAVFIVYSWDFDFLCNLEVVQEEVLKYFQVDEFQNFSNYAIIYQSHYMVAYNIST